MHNLIDKGTSFSTEDLITGGLFLVDKPLHWTSFDVVNKLRYAIRKKLGLKKYKIGHAGTLDPLATGLLIICFSKYTKQIESFTVWPKSYTGSITLWATTPGYDKELPIDTYYPVVPFTSELLNNTREQFIGKIDQYPPIFSAIKKNGIPLYRLARKGEKIEIKSRQVEITNFEFLDVRLPEIDFSVDCSKGTYIRSIAYDFGKRLNNGSYLSSLRRTKIGSYNVDDAWEILTLCDAIDKT